MFGYYSCLKILKVTADFDGFYLFVRAFQK